MSHRDTVFEAPPGFTALASSTASPVAAFESVERGIYGIQFHPEVVHTPYGQDVLKTFLGRRLRLRHDVVGGVDRRGADRSASATQVGDGKVICGLSRRRRLVASPRCSCTARSATSSRACSSTTA